MAAENEIASPPAAIERIVRMLVPPPAREHLLGDLAECYRSPGQYLRDALRTLPFVIGSQIRRTTNFAMLPSVAVRLMVGFGVGENVGGAAVATAATLLGYMVRDAYRVLDLGRVWRQGLVDTLVVAAFVSASQALLAIVRPDWMLSPGRTAAAALMLGLFYLLRAQNPSGGLQPWLTSAGPMSLEELRTEVRLYAQRSRRAMAIEVGVGVAIAPVFAATAVFGPPSPAKAGAILTVFGILFVAFYIRRHMRWQAPLDLGFAETLAQYRARLERNHSWLRNVWMWYLLPLGIGPFVMLIAGPLTTQQPVSQIAGVVGVSALLWVFVLMMSRRAAQGLRQRLDALAVVEERR
jgi:hypothetical protein